MDDRAIRAVRLRVASLCALAILASILSGCAARQSVGSRAYPTGTVEAITEIPAPREALVPAAERDTTGGPHEGIKVHGHWTIEVRNPDGALVTHREFENSLSPQTGPLGLANVLGRVHSVGLWQVAIGNIIQSPTQPCFAPAGNFAIACFMQEPGDTSNGPFDFQTLTVSVPTTGPNTGALVLSGSFTVQTSSALAEYSTSFYYCAGTVAPATCGTQNVFTFFTFAQISPINVAAGQLVQVTVVLSFS
jgi:hypothetical protein